LLNILKLYVYGQFGIQNDKDLFERYYSKSIQHVGLKKIFYYWNKQHREDIWWTHTNARLSWGQPNPKLRFMFGDKVNNTTTKLEREATFAWTKADQ
jgi:hypothetical protein